MKSLVNKQIAFVAANISLILKDKVWFDLRGTEDVAHEVSSILMSYNALSACFENYEKMHESEPDMYDYINEIDSWFFIQLVFVKYTFNLITLDDYMEILDASDKDNAP